MINDYLYKSSEVFINVDKSIDDFYDEAYVIDYAKCVLINRQELDDYSVNGINVFVHGDDSDYYLSYNDVVLHIYVQDHLITDYNRE